MVTVNPYQQPMRYMIALVIAILDLILIVITLIRYLLALQPAFLIPFPQVLMDAGSWFTVAVMCFYCALLVTLYGVLSLWLREQPFILWFGAGLVVFAGLFYLLAAVMYYRSEGMSAPVQQGIFMFLLSFTIPILAGMLSRRIKRIQLSNDVKVEIVMNTYPQPTR